MVTVVIQAGGKSSRMGREKGLVRLGKLTLIEHVMTHLAGLGDEVVITTNRPKSYAFLGVPLYADPTPGAGVAYGLQTALTAANGEVVLVAACDMPFIQPSVCQYMLDKAKPGVDVVVPFRQGFYEPLLAVYRRDPCLTALNQALDRGQARLISFYPQVHVLRVVDDELDRLDPEGLSFFNINTPEDLAKAESLLGAK